jgi:hypothetical protein
MSYTLDDHDDRLEFLGHDKEAILCLNFVNYLPNESFSTKQETYATFNHIFVHPTLNCGYDCVCFYYVLQILNLICAWSSS